MSTLTQITSPRGKLMDGIFIFHKNVRISGRVCAVFSEDLMFWTLMDRRVVRFFSWLSESFLPIPSLPELQRLPTSQLIKHFLCLPLSHSPRPDPVLAIPVSPAKTQFSELNLTSLISIKFSPQTQQKKVQNQINRRR